MEVHQDDIRPQASCDFDCLPAVGGLAHDFDSTGELQGNPQILSDLGDVVGDQHPDWSYGSWFL